MICELCGHVQKKQDPVWQADVARIYGEYEMYILSGGAEQVIFEGATPSPRTQRMLECFRKKANLPSTGSMLDIGCGNGSTLRTFSSLCPGWQLAGYDLHNRFESTVRSIPGLDAFYHGSLDSIDRQFDLISLVYVIEHIPEPLDAVAALQRLLKPGGLLLVQTSNYWDNPFDLTVVDHCSHFNVDTLAATVARAGYEILDRNDHWIAKEVGVIARPASESSPAQPECVRPDAVQRGSDQRLRWLGRVVKEASTVGPDGIGIFGTAIAGTWLASMVPDAVKFFVDEDRHRTGKSHLGLPVLHTHDVPERAPVYLAFPTQVAEKIRTRLRSQAPRLQLISPSLYEAA
jgi:SAM-dependent methyltransferase